MNKTPSLGLCPAPPEATADADPKMEFYFMGAYSKLHNLTYSKIKYAFPEFNIEENAHPEWLISKNLTRLELDIYIKEINTAFEIQGVQHFQFTPYFHKSISEFEEQKYRDEEKKYLCSGKGVKLIEVVTELDIDIAIKEMYKKYFKPTEKYTQFDCSSSVVAARMLKRFKKKLVLLKKKDIVPIF